MERYALVAAFTMSVAVCQAQSRREDTPIQHTDSIAEQLVVQERGVDRRVPYDSLKAVGPWDDRNYKLTREDLELLAANEGELRDPIPAFFRVMLRRANPGLRKEGAAQYPRNAVQIFLAQCGGYLVNGKLYTQVTVKNGRFIVIERDGVEAKPGASGRPGRCDV